MSRRLADRAHGRGGARRGQPRAPPPRHAHGRNARRPAFLVVRDLAAGGRRLCRPARPRRTSGRAGAEPPAQVSARCRSDRVPPRPAGGQDAGHRGAAGVRPRRRAPRRLGPLAGGCGPSSRPPRPGGASACKGSRSRPRRLGRRTRSLRLADSSPLQNRLLGAGDNAAFGLALAGPPQPAGRVPRELPRLRDGERALGSAALLEAAARGPRPGGDRLHGRPWPPLRAARGGGQDPRAAAPRVRRLPRCGRRPEQAARRLRSDPCAARLATPCSAGPRFRRMRGTLRSGPRRAESVSRRRTPRHSSRPVETDADVLAVGRAAARIRQDHR